MKGYIKHYMGMHIEIWVEAYMLKDSINICKEACFFVLNRSRFQHLKKKSTVWTQHWNELS